MAKTNHLGAGALGAGALVAVGMLVLMVLVVKVGPAAATAEQKIIAYTEVGTSDTAKNGSSDIVLWIRSSNGYRQG
jgi:hypothetical protein